LGCIASKLKETDPEYPTADLQEEWKDRSRSTEISAQHPNHCWPRPIYGPPGRMERPFEIYGNIGAASRALLAETLNGTTTGIGAASRALPAETDPRIDDKYRRSIKSVAGRDTPMRRTDKGCWSMSPEQYVKAVVTNVEDRQIVLVHERRRPQQQWSALH
jgi:hypothetical protein